MSGKTKTRFTTLDVTAMVAELRSKLVGLRINNIYDLNTKTYVFKLTRSETKEFLILESGVRFHTTSMNSEKNKIPSPFTMKLRKYLREKRLEDIQQIGVERVVDFTFGREDSEYHILLELYASGNLILTDGQYKILALIRSHEFNEEIKTAVGETYPFEQAANLKLESFRTDSEHINDLINQEPAQNKTEDQEDAQSTTTEQASKNKKGGKEKNAGAGKKDGKKENNKQTKDKDKKKNIKKLKDILFKLLPCFHQSMIDQLLKDKNLNPNTKASEEHIGALQEIANESIDFLKAFAQTKPVGYLSYKTLETEESSTVDKENKPAEINQESQEVKPAAKEWIKYLEFSPIPLKTGDKVKEMNSFDKAVDEFFTKHDLPDAQKNKEEKKKLAWKKFENIKHDQETRMKKLKAEQDECLQKALLIEHNLKNVDVIINIVGAMVQGGLGWDKIWKMINESKSNGDPFASMITKLKLDIDQVVILLKDPHDPDAEFKEVEVDIKNKAFMNAERFYQEKKKMEVKERKTMEASQQALKLAERAAMNEVNHEKQKIHALITRKTYWFEKFYWFITSENYLVISGRDAQQNELVVKRYLKKEDVYMHADIHGAGSVVIKNPTGKTLPKATLDEAAIFTVCRSKAWESKIITSAWWVYSHQVSKTAQSGEYLPTGSFMVRGKKNFLNPSRLEMGFGLLFKIDESSLARHINDRKLRFEDDQSVEIKDIITQTSEQEADQFYITGQVRPIITTYDKSKNQNKPKQGGGAKEKPPVQVQEEKKSAVLDDDDDEDEFRALRKAPSKAESEDIKSVEGGADNKLKNITKIPRGKRAKIQKMKEKYADQDEEERELRFKLTGAREIKELRDDKNSESDDDWDKKGKKKNKGKDKDKDKGKSKGKQQEQPQKPKQQTQKPQPPKNANQDSQKNKKVNQAEANGNEPVKAKEDDGEKPNLAPEEPKNVPVPVPQEDSENAVKSSNDVAEIEEMEIAKSKTELENEDAVDENENEVDKTQDEPAEPQTEAEDLKMLISVPHPEDTILFAVPVCAPYVTLQNYKFKSKLLPGTLKKGKAVKSVMSVFLSQKELPEVERKLMKTMGETELVNAMIGNVKIGAAGLLKVKQKEKQAKDQKKKELRSQEKKTEKK